MSVFYLLEDSDRFWQWLLRRDKKLYRPAAIRTWAIVIYESQGRFRQDTARDMARGFIEGALSVGKYILYIRFFFAAKLINFTQEWLCPILNRWSSGRTGKETLEMYVFFFFFMLHSRRWRDLTYFSSAYEESWQGLPRSEGKPSQSDRCRPSRGRQWNLFGC